MTPSHTHRERHPDHTIWSVLFDIFDGLIVVLYLLFALFPGRVLAYASDHALGLQPLVFVRDSAFAGQTVAELLASEAFNLSASLGEGSVVQVLTVAYSSTPDQTDGNPQVTASGARVGRGVLAANFLPLGSQVRIGQQIYTVLDRMHPRYDEKYVVDLWMPSRVAALQYGARVVEMEIVSLP